MLKHHHEAPLSAAVETLRWMEEARHWLRSCALPATVEQLTAQLLAMCAPNWLLWRLNAAAPDNRVLDSVDVVLHLLQHPERHRDSVQQTRFYAG
jgi:hypothetical protein